MQDLNEFILSNKWLSKVRGNNKALAFSLRYLGELKYLPKYYKKPIDIILIPQNKKLIKQVLTKTETEFHNITLDFFTSHYFENLIIKDQALLKELDNIKINKTNFDNISEKFMLHESNAMQIVSFGIVANKNSQLINSVDVQITLKAHDSWRNSIFVYEERFFKQLQKYLDSEFGTGKNIIKFITLPELKQKTKTELKKIISERQKSNCIYYGINKEFGTITNKVQIKKITAYLSIKDISKEIKGNTTYLSKSIEGEAIVIKTHKDLKKITPEKLKNKILITHQTCPHFIPYLKNVIGIVTDEGGITCHAAILSRELKIPCIIGTQNATKKIKTGQKIKMDLDKGEIVILN